jgi:signal transduction histidine kinase
MTGHSLLKRQLKLFFGGAERIPKKWQAFIEAVDRAYLEADADRKMLERSLELSSQELLQANSEMRAMVQAFPDIFFLLDKDGTILSHKGGTSTDFVLSPALLMGKRVQDAPLATVGTLFQRAIREVHEQNAIVSVEYVLPGQNREVHYEARLVPLGDTHMLMIVRNISERKETEVALRNAQHALEDRVRERTEELVKANQALRDEIAERKRGEEERRHLEDQLRQAQKMEAVGQLAGGIAHDFNNMLTVITGYSQLLLEGLTRNDPLRVNVQQIQEASGRASALTTQLLAFSRRQVLQPKVLNLNTIVGNIEGMLGSLIGEDITLTTKPFQTPALVEADPGQIEQVIMNLAVNARDAMPKGGQLTIETFAADLHEVPLSSHDRIPPGNYIVLAVSDTGHGMDAKTQARIFEPFFTTKEPGKGTGLGLSTVYGIVTQSSGYLFVYSELEKGTTFKIYLPRVMKDTTAVAPMPAVMLPMHGTETILLAEDEEMVRTWAAGVLRSKGYRVLTARNGKEALRTMEAHAGPLHLLVTDVVMPEMGGRELTERVTSLHPTIKVLYMSGYTDDAVIRHGVLNAGAAFLQKPFTPNMLASKVRELLDV